MPILEVQAETANVVAVLKKTQRPLPSLFLISSGEPGIVVPESMILDPDVVDGFHKIALRLVGLLLRGGLISYREHPDLPLSIVQGISGVAIPDKQQFWIHYHEHGLAWLTQDILKRLG